MPLDPDFLALLVSPRTRKPLRELTIEELSGVNAMIASGRVAKPDGSAWSDAIEGGLIETEGSPESVEIYPVLDRIPVLLQTESLQQRAPAT